MKIGTGITVGGGISIGVSIAGDTDLAFNSVDFINQFTYSTNTSSVAFNANGTITATDVGQGPTRWYTTTPDATIYEIAVTLTTFNIFGSGTGVFSIAGVPQSLNVKSSYYPLTSGVTVNATYTGYNPFGDELFLRYTIFIRRTDLSKEITRSGNQIDIAPEV